MRSISASMKRLEIVKEVDDFHVVETPAAARVSVLDNFKASVAYLYKNTNLFGTADDITVPEIGQMKSFVSARVGALPQTYQRDYAMPLVARFGQVLQEIGGDPSTAETISAAVYQHSPDYVPTQGYLNRFQAVCATLYDDFFDNEVRDKLDLPLIEKVPPLAMFQKNGQAGPFTIPSDAIKELFGGSVGVVSLPGVYRQHPLLWASLAHEVGGHDVLHADPGLLGELGQAVKNSLRNEDDPSLGALWQYWIDETASDVYGLLHYGPEFALNLAIFFSAINLQISGPNADWLRFKSFAFQGQLDPHPTDILRLSVAKGAIGALTSLSTTSKTNYEGLLDSIIDFVVGMNGGHTTVFLQGFGKQTYDLKRMQAVAERVGRIITTQRLSALKGHTIQDITTWSQDDEAIASNLVRTLLDRNADISKLPAESTAAHVLSSASLAVLTDPSASAYATMTANVNKLLDAAFKADPLWNPKKTLTMRHLYIGESGPGAGVASTLSSHEEKKKEPIRPFWL